MKKPVRRQEFDILYGGKHCLAAHESSKGKLFWPLPGGDIVSRMGALAYAMEHGGVRQ